MNEYSDECILTFLKNQGQLFSEPVAETMESSRVPSMSKIALCSLITTFLSHLFFQLRPL